MNTGGGNRCLVVTAGRVKHRSGCPPRAGDAWAPGAAAPRWGRRSCQPSLRPQLPFGVSTGKPSHRVPTCSEAACGQPFAEHCRRLQ